MRRLTISICLMTAMAFEFTCASPGIQKVLSIAGDGRGSETAEVAILELGIRYMIFLMDSRKGLHDEVYYLGVGPRASAELPPELIERLRDLPVEFKPVTNRILTWKVGRENTYAPPGRWIIVRIVEWVSDTEVRIDVLEGLGGPGLGFNTTVKWDNGSWTLIEPDALSM
jgi:hypothetical protein